MQTPKQDSVPQIALVAYPYHSSKHTGRGHDRYTFELAENLRELCPDVRVRVVDQGFSSGVLAAGRKLVQLCSDLARERAQLFHAISPIGGAAAALLGRRPLVVTIHDLIPFQVAGFEPSWKIRYIRRCAQICVRKADAIVVPYAVTKREIVSRLGGDAAKVHVVNYGVDHSTYHPRPELQRDGRRILYIGEVSFSKGVDVLVRAFAKLKQGIPDAKLLIGGKPSKDQPAIEQLSRSLGVGDIEFAGYIPEADLPTHYSTTSVMVFPSKYGFGLSTLEAMACGTPVVAAAALDAPEFIADAGLLVAPDDADDFALNIGRILLDPALRDDLSVRGIERAKRFSWSAMALATREVYDHLLPSSIRAR